MFQIGGARKLCGLRCLERRDRILRELGRCRLQVAGALAQDPRRRIDIGDRREHRRCLAEPPGTIGRECGAERRSQSRAFGAPIAVRTVPETRIEVP
jgi:hypothetical protein